MITEMNGKTFGRLQVIRRNGNLRKEARWECVCDCGNTVFAGGYTLRSGNTKSCGCLQKDRVAEASTTHGKSKTKIYTVWNNMMARCYNEKNDEYHNYGGRGITVTSKWHIFTRFYADMGEPNSLTLERINVNKGYSPDNCKWATLKEQARNRRSTTNTGIVGVTLRECGKKFRAGIRVDGRQIDLVTTPDFFEACCKRKSAELRYWNG